MSELSNPDLKPCPFCSSLDIKIYAIDDTLADNGVWKVYCNLCPVEMTSSYLLGNYCKGNKPMKFKELINNWNRRSNEVHRKHPKSSRVVKETGPP